MPRKQFKGTIVSDKMEKTVVVKVETIVSHPKYKKRHRAFKKYKAHCQKGDFKVGDKVVIEECRPMSRGKKWVVKSKI